ncbi:hypothetical protein LCGC14_1736300, partial [marine sediment metagenome]
GFCYAQGNLVTPNPCSHGILRIMCLNALGATVGCLKCNETFDLPADVMEERYYLFRHFSPKGEMHDIQLLVREGQL